ncbi:MAG TPA: acyl-CoA dehydrogenase family protein [Actinomycetota bacterium]
MNFDLTPEQEDFRKVVREFAEEIVAPGAAERDAKEEFPLDVVRRMAELGLFGLPFPEEFGGSEADSVTMCLAIEELGRVDQSVGITLSAAVGLGGGMIDRFGTPEQKERWLRRVAAGEILASFCLTEPGGGSDAAAARTVARPDGDGWVLDGAKAFITNCGTPISGVHVVAAATEPEGGKRGLSTFLVPADAAGITIEAPYRKLGWHASDTHGVVFEDVRLPADALLGERGRGFAQCLAILTGARITISALAVGLAQACLDESVTYANERQAFGRSIGANQLIQGKLADMRVAVESARLLTYRAAWLKDEGREHVAEASIAKLAASEAAVTSAREAAQIFGGYGFMEEYPIARFYRDAKVLEIGEGTSEIHRLILGRDLGLPESI